jgi:ATP-binding cassette subfamily B multidrug efflux pump
VASLAAMSTQPDSTINASHAAQSTSLTPPGQEPLALVPTSANRPRSVIGFDARTLMRITHMAFNHPWRMGIAIIATIIAAISQLAVPQFIGAAVDSAQGLLGNGALASEQAREALSGWALLLLITAIIRGASTMLQNYHGEAVGHLIAYELRLAYYKKLQHLSFSYHDRIHTGELMTRGMLDIEGTRMWVHTGVLRVVLLVFLIGGGVWMLASIDPLLTVVALSFVPLVGIGASIARLKLRRLWYELQEELGVLTRVMEENLGGIRVVRSFASQAFELARFDVISKRALAILHRRIDTFVKSTTSMTFAYFLSMALVLWVGGGRVLDGRLSVGELTAFLAFMTILQMPVRQIAWMVNSIARASTCGSRLFEIIDLEPEIRDHPDAADLAPGPGTVRFENVSFSYQDANGEQTLPVLDGIDFEVTRGKTVGIVGPPGSGKSTIAHLLPRYYDVSSGRITIDGQDIRDVSLRSVRSWVSVVQQDSFLFSSAIDNNVAYGDPWAERSAIRQATEAAQLHQYIAQLPAGYDTLVGERGVSLSGGQRQRLAIARAVVPDSQVIVFDDATAAIDAGTEHDIRQALRELTRDRAVIIIAHRLSSLMHADEILFVDAGRIVERGSHDDLMAQGGRYANLNILQSTSGALEVES